MKDLLIILSFVILNSVSCVGNNIDVEINKSESFQADNSRENSQNTGSGVFDSMFTNLTGTEPLCISTTDFNKDSFADLVVTNRNAGTISVFINNQNGGFNNKIDLSLSANSWGVAVGDLDNDSNKDIIVGSRLSGIDIFYGNGDGTFEPLVNIDISGFARGVQIADLNSDGRVDIVIADSANLKVLLATGARSYAAAATVNSTANPVEIVIGDFNLDGILDIAQNDLTNQFFGVMMGNGDGSFGSVTSYSVPGVDGEFIAAGDMDNDGDQDIFVPNGTTNNVSIFQNNGAGVFTKLSDEVVGNYPGDVKVFDFNSDGNLDLLVSNYDDNNISILFGNGDGTFQNKVDYPAGVGPWGMTIADFNQDSIIDIAVANYGENTLGILNGL